MDTSTDIVTGAFGEIGTAVCEELASRGRTIIRAGRHLPEGSKPGCSGRFIDVQADLATPDGWQSLLDTALQCCLTPDTVVHCAGSFITEEPMKMSPAGFRSMLDDNLLTLMLGFRALLPPMLERRRGHIVVVGSLGGIIPMPHGSVYAATKFGVRGLALSTAEELRGSGVSLSLLSCGPVDSPMLRREAEGKGTIGFVNRPLSPSAVAAAVVQLLDHPRKERLLPASLGLIGPVIGGFPRLFGLLAPLASALGVSGKKRYRSPAARGTSIPKA
jgi:short-subunit dehydrogenase